MKRLCAVCLLICPLALTSASPVASAQERGRGGPPQFGFGLSAVLDVNQDAMISDAEIANASAVLAALDRNGDGRLEATELMGGGRGGRGRGGRGERGGDGGEGGGRGRDEGGAAPAVNADELIATLMTFDANGDKQLTRAELPERMQPIFDRADSNKDGKLTVDEIRASAAPAAPAAGGRGRGGAGGGADPLFAALDANHDGSLDADEVAKAPASLRTLDLNKDGQLSAAEYRQTGRGQ